MVALGESFDGDGFGGCFLRGLWHGRNVGIFGRNGTPFRARRAPDFLPSGFDYSAACNAAVGFLGAIQNASGLSNRKFAPNLKARRQMASAPKRATIVTTNDIAPTS